MGSMTSRILLFSILVLEIMAETPFEEVLARVKTSPDIPVPNPTKSFWMDQLSKISSTNNTGPFPTSAEVVIIGSGITGTSIARTLLQEASKSGHGNMKVVMLEARQTCSGATGRNGGHINPGLFEEYPFLKETYGIEEAQKIIRFRLSHFVEIKRAAEEEGILQRSQVRQVESENVYFSEELFEESKESLKLFQHDMPDVSGDEHAYEREDAIQRFRIAKDILGVVSHNAGAAHPYRFVTGTLEKLLAKYPRMLEIYTETPGTSIHPPTAASPFYRIETPRGTIQAKHIVHATNAWVTHHVPGLRGKIIPLRGTMSAQRPGAALSPSTHDGGRSWTFNDGGIAFDYLTQLPDGERELMYGGGGFITLRPGLTVADRSNLLRGVGHGDKDGPVSTGGLYYTELGTARDDLLTRSMANHLIGSLGLRFGLENWGAESLPTNSSGDGKWFQGRVKALWTGVLGMSTDNNPWVGRLTSDLTGRNSSWKGAQDISSTDSVQDITSASDPAHHSNRPSPATAPAGEWISAGYTGEGMTHAWMSGRALAYMILGKEREGRVNEWFPDVYRLSDERVKANNPEDLLHGLGL